MRSQSSDEAHSADAIQGPSSTYWMIVVLEDSQLPHEPLRTKTLLCHAFTSRWSLIAVLFRKLLLSLDLGVNRKGGQFRALCRL